MGGSGAPPFRPSCSRPLASVEPVDRVVGVVGARLDAVVPEEDDVLDVGVVLDVGDVSRRVVGVGQVLHGLLRGGELRAVVVRLVSRNVFGS